MSNDLSQQQIDRITDTIADGQKIEAIKQYKTATGCDLREAKDFIDTLTNRLAAEDPERFAKATTTVKLNLVGALLLALIVVGVGLALFLGTQ